VQDLAIKLKVVFDRLQPPETDPMFDFDERDLLTFVEQAGFTEWHLELRVDVRPQVPMGWELYAQTAPNPLALTLEEAMAFRAHLSPLVKHGAGTSTTAVAYLRAVKS
jgi:hypothetical protein